MAEKEPKGKRKSLPEDAEAYISMAREKASPSGKIMQRVQAANEQRLENVQEPEKYGFASGAYAW